MKNKNTGQVLPLWASVALIARCARRYAELFGENTAEPASVRATVTEAVQLAEMRASLGGVQEIMTEALQLEEIFFDNYDILAIYNALGVYLNAAENTLSDLSGDPVPESEARQIFVAIRLAGLALEAAFPEELELDGNSPPDYMKAIDWAIFGDPELRSCVERDLEHAQHLSRREDWENELAISPDVFGPP